MDSFSNTLRDKTSFPSKDLKRLNKLIKVQKTLENEKELETFLDKLPKDLSVYRDKVDIYLRHRDMIQYCNIDDNQARKLYTSIRHYFPPKGIKMFDIFFSLESAKCLPVKLLGFLTRIITSSQDNPSCTLICLSLIQYIQEVVVLDTDNTEVNDIESTESSLET